MTSQDGQRGYALVTVLLLLALISALLVGYFALTSVEMTTTGCSLYGVRGFYAAEAGLNIRAKKIRGIFQDYRLPSGTAPVIGGTPPPCEGTNQGTGDLGCEQYALREDLVTTFVEETAGNPVSIAIPRGEPFQNINAQEYRYIIDSDAEGRDGRTQAVLEMRLKSRLVPLFQFAAFYGKDLEILPGPVMTLSGPVHTNGDLYLDPGAQLDIHGQVTTAGDLYRGRKKTDSCNVSLLQVIDPDSLAPLPPCIGGRREYSEADLAPWNGMVRAGGGNGERAAAGGVRSGCRRAVLGPGRSAHHARPQRRSVHRGPQRRRVRARCRNDRAGQLRGRYLQRQLLQQPGGGLRSRCSTSTSWRC